MLRGLQTPAFTVNLDVMERNIHRVQKLCDTNGKALWPMVKTHKSTAIARMQLQAGARGFLCGTLDECEQLANAGIEQIMYAYPVSTQPNIGRVVALARRPGFVIRLDCIEAAEKINHAAERANATVKCCIIIDSGLHRFGIAPEHTGTFATALERYKNIKVVGIATHPGHVYGSDNAAGVAQCARDERTTMSIAVECMRAGGHPISMVCSGATPTFPTAVTDENINILHPGNYVFNDVIQLSLGAAPPADCALTVLASVISRRPDGVLLIDAGTKCLGLDQGAHGNSAVKGFGRVKGHPEVAVSSLSEEVGKLSIAGECALQVGSKIEIIPNHACVPANLTSHLWAHRADGTLQRIDIDMRGNSDYSKQP